MSETVITTGGGLRARLRYGIGWNFVSTICNQGGTLGMNVLIANLLGKQVFGEFAIIQSTLALLGNIAQCATGTTATKYVAELRSVNRTRTAGVLRLCAAVSTFTATAAAALLLLSAPWLTREVLHAPQLALPLMLAVGIALFTVLNGYQAGALAGFESYRALAQAGVLFGVMQLVLGGLGAWWAGLGGALLGLTVATAARWWLSGRYLRAACERHALPVDAPQVWRERHILYQFALPSAISGLTSLPALWLANAFLVRQPHGYEQLALFSAANSLRLIVLVLPGIVNNVGTSLINHQYGCANARQYRRLFWANCALTCVVLAGVIPAASYGAPFLLRMFGRSFDGGHSVLVILMLATIPEALAVAAYQIVQSQSRMWLSLFAVAVPRDGLIVVTAYCLVPHYGAAGVAWAYVLGWSVALVSILLIVARLGLYVRRSPAPVRPACSEVPLLSGIAS